MGDFKALFTGVPVSVTKILPGYSSLVMGFSLNMRRAEPILYLQSELFEFNILIN